MNQEDVRRKTLARVEASTAHIEALRATLTPQRLAWTPPEGGWSIGMVFEHLCLANGDYLERMHRLVHGETPAGRTAAAARWRPSLMGWLLVKSLETRHHMPAPTLWLPPAEPRAHVVESFLEQQRQQRDLLEASSGLAWRRIRTTSPVSSFVRLNLGDCFVILAVHTERHLRQIDRVAAHASFPAVS